MRTLLENEHKVGMFVSPDDPLWDELEIMIGDEKQKYGDLRIDNSGALIVPLCPEQVYDTENQVWKKADQVKVYQIEPVVVVGILNG